MGHNKNFKSLIFLFNLRWLVGGGQAPAEEFTNRRRPARHSMPKSEVLNGLQFIQRDGDL